MKYKHQGGWVASFLIVGILLTLAVLGGLYYVKSNQKQLAGTATNQSATKEEAAPKQKTTAEQKTDTTVVPQKDEKKGETVDTNTKPGTGSTTQPQSTSTPTAPVAPTTPSTTTAPSSPSTTTPSTSKSDAPKPSAKLPATGPEDTVLNAIILAIVAFATTTYIRSRKTI